MRLTMKERKAVTKASCEAYRKARKRDKSRILNQFVEMTGYHRKYAAWLLRNHGRRVEVAPGRAVAGDARQRRSQARRRTYGPELLKPLKKVWVTMDYICGKRLHAALPEVLPRLVACREVRIKKADREKLLAMSPATIDRMLAAERAKHTLKGVSRTKPGTLLKHQIPVRTFAEWDHARPGFFEMDLVAHEGGCARGDFCHTLDITDVATGWSEQMAVQNKAQIHVFAAIEALRARLPIPVLGLDSDNGSEFINNQLFRYCEREQVTMTRSRTTHKNDTCYVEQKNWTIVRRFVGYARFEGPEACAVLNELYAVLRDYNNFLFPSVKLVEKTRNGARVTKRYDKPQTPYQRMLDSPEVPRRIKNKLRAHYETLNPAALHRRILALQKRLAALAVRTTGEEATA